VPLSTSALAPLSPQATEGLERNGGEGDGLHGEKRIERRGRKRKPRTAEEEQMEREKAQRRERRRLEREGAGLDARGRPRKVCPFRVHPPPFSSFLLLLLLPPPPPPSPSSSLLLLLLILLDKEEKQELDGVCVEELHCVCGRVCVKSMLSTLIVSRVKEMRSVLSNSSRIKLFQIASGRIGEARPAPRRRYGQKRMSGGTKGRTVSVGQGRR
jgi:hypothetical protein